MSFTFRLFVFGLIIENAIITISSQNNIAIFKCKTASSIFLLLIYSLMFYSKIAVENRYC